MTDLLREQTMTINMGPHHPSTHGVLRLVLELDGETVRRTVPHVGYLHSGFEKTMEYRTYQQCITYTDRLDYLGAMGHNLAFCLSAERILGSEVPPRGQAIRVLVTELSRIASHLVWLGTHLLELGAITPFFYAFRQRDLILDLLEEICGQRLTFSYLRVGGVRQDLPPRFLEHVNDFLAGFRKAIAEFERLITGNEIFRKRTIGVGKLTAEQCLAWSVTGANLRAAGVPYDLRRVAPYSGYERYDFAIPTHTDGDTYARYLVRMEEMRQSARICRQIVDDLPGGPTNDPNRHITLPPRSELEDSMEAVIFHFKLVTEGFHPPLGEAYIPTEGTKGELGYYLVSDGGSRPYRVYVRTPCFYNLQGLPVMAEGGLVADVIACIGSLDLVMGEVDR